MKIELAVFSRLIDRFSKTKILVIGDMMVDRFVRGKVSRISPEAPVPVVHVRDESNLPGGAGNVIMNIASLGGQVMACGVIGKDEAGRELVSRFQKCGVETDGLVKNSSRSTILKTRVIAEHQQIVRFDYEDVGSMTHSDHLKIQDYAQRTIPKSDGIILSDYGKGIISKPLLTQAISAAKRYRKPICVDPKIEHFLSYRGVTCITPNVQEALGGMRRVRLDGSDGVSQLGKDILKKLKCKSVLITQGENGMTLFEKNRATHIPTHAQEVYDVTGAGDTVISVLSLALACGASFIQAAILSNLAAGIVVGKLGTATVTIHELKEAVKELKHLTI